MYENSFPNKRYKHTAEFLKEVLPKGSKILDLGITNPFAEIMKAEGYAVKNTKGEDLDLNTQAVKEANVDAVTAFEIFEHMVAPFQALKDIKADKLVASVPLKLWFAPAYKSKTDIIMNLKIGNSIGC